MDASVYITNKQKKRDGATKKILKFRRIIVLFTNEGFLRTVLLRQLSRCRTCNRVIAQAPTTLSHIILTPSRPVTTARRSQQDRRSPDPILKPTPMMLNFGVLMGTGVSPLLGRCPLCLSVSVLIYHIT